MPPAPAKSPESSTGWTYPLPPGTRGPDAACRIELLHTRAGVGPRTHEQHTQTPRTQPSEPTDLSTSPDLCLASGSEIRARLLRDAGLSILTAPVRIDETTVRTALEGEGATPRDIADTLAEMKAQKAAAKGLHRLVLGCDQVLALGREILGKPGSRDEAAEQLARLSGQTHQLLSAAVLYEDTAPVWRHVGVVRLTMRALSADRIDRYLDRTWPTVATSVGAYQLESEGIRLFTRVDGDYFTVLGLPLVELLNALILRGDIDG